jgi:hypothetical protein
MNPIMKNVFAAYEAVAVRPTSISIDRTGVALPRGGHFQGIQRMLVEPIPRETRQQKLLVITSSSNQEAYFVACSMADDWLSGRANVPFKMTGLDPSFNHAGGCQAFGHFLAAGLENSAETNSEIQFWDFERFPKKVPPTIERPGSGHTFTAGAVGLTSYGSGTVLAVATFNADTIDFYTSKADPFRGSPLTWQFTWKASEANKSGWIDDNFGTYQNINLITQVDGQLFMVAFDRSGYSDWMDLFTVNLDGDHSFALRKAAKKHMYCTDGCAFDAGAGIFIASEDEFDVYAVNGSSGDHNTGTTIHVNYFSAT